MRGLLAAVIAFALLIVGQFIVWRVLRPAGHYLALSGLYLVALAGAVGVFIAVAPVTALAAWIVPSTLREAFDFLLLYTAATLTYMVTYSAVQADSPSMMILLAIERAGADGLKCDDLIAELGDHVVVVPRLEDLVTGSLATVQRSRYVINGRGALLARLYIGYRALLKMEKGG